jgi:hypothetical protein
MLLAVSTGFGLVLLILTAATYGAGGSPLRYGLLAVICGGSYVALSPLLMKAVKQPPLAPMIQPDVRSSGVWAGLFPMVVMIAALVPVIRPGYDYGLLIIIGAIWFGRTVQSALMARSQAG